MPSLVMLPFIQCHHTRGRAPSGGAVKPLCNASTPALAFAAGAAVCAPATVTASTSTNAANFMALPFIAPLLLALASPTTNGRPRSRF